MSEIPLGTYQHFKGKLYTVLGTVKHSETEEVLVLYKRQSEAQLWVRPLVMFIETVEYEGIKMPRFRYLEGHVFERETN